MSAPAPGRPEGQGEGEGDSEDERAHRSGRAGAWIQARTRDPAVLITLLVLVGYFTIARLVENLYPFSTFPMYSSEHTDSASRILAREADGSVYEASEYAAWSCDEAINLDRERALCASLPRYSTIPYIDRGIVDQIRDRTRAGSGAPAGGAPVTIVRRVFRFPSGPGPASVEDCAIGQCRAVRR